MKMCFWHFNTHFSGAGGQKLRKIKPKIVYLMKKKLDL